jgi:NAD(P)-dependent dehydrogenase (short-subunit alcohol dehydrogenase family)
MKVNVKPIYLSAQVFVPHMRQNGSGVFVNVASSTAMRPRAEYTFYGASKAAAVASTKAMAVEYAPTIRLNTMCVQNPAPCRCSPHPTRSSPSMGATPMCAIARIYPFAS